MPDAPKVFISYSHDGPAHETRVLELANRLREDGIDAEIDQYETSPGEGWPTWCERRIEEADFVLLVCTEIYRGRFDAREPGKGLGVLYEARTIRQLINDDSARTTKYIPVLLDGGLPAHIPTIVKGATRWEVETPEGYEGLYRQLTRQPVAVRRELGAIKPMPPRQSRSGAAAAAVEAVAAPAPCAAASSAPHARVREVFVGRQAQLAVLAACLLPADADQRRPVAVTGMGGIGKSYLVDRFLVEHRAAFAGGYHRLALDAEKPGSAGELLALLADRLKLPAAADDAAIAAALGSPLALLHVENIDTPEAAAIAGALAVRLPGCALVFSARMGRLAAGTGWGEAALAAFGEEDALAQLHAELGASTPPDDALRPVIAALGGLPLALHLAAGHLQGGETPASFLRLLRRQGLSLAPLSPADPSFFERSHSRLEAVFTLSLAALGRAAEARGQPATAWTAAFHALGYGPAAGFGESLGAAIAGLGDDDFADLARAASALSLLDRVPRGGGTALRLHPLLAGLGRGQVSQEGVVARMTGWFCARLPMPGAGKEWRWNEVHAETAALLEWLSLVPPAERVRVVWAGSRFAINTGPLHAWRRFCEVALAEATDDAQRSDILWTLGNVALRGGDLDEALHRAREKRDLDLARSEDREAALAAGLIADILQARGQLDEALRIRTEEQLPVYERLGDVRSRAVTMGQIADILQARGQLDDALRILREELLPAFERLGDVRSRAVTMGQIADILQARGQLDDALRIRTEEQLPVYERLGDVRSRAVTMGKIADILQARGQLDDALRILREELLPAFERLGDVRSRAVTMGKIADALAQQGNLDEAIRIYQEEVLPSYVRLGDARMLVIDRWWLASHLLRRGTTEDREQAERLLGLALADARRLRIPEAAQIEAFLQQHGLPCPAAPAPSPAAVPSPALREREGPASAGG